MSQASIELFRQACGAARPLELEVVRSGETETRRYVLESPCAVLGRDVDADLCLLDEAVSGRHVWLQVLAGRLAWVDLASRAGVICRGESSPSGWLDHGETIQIGPFEVRLAAPFLGEAGSVVARYGEVAPLDLRVTEGEETAPAGLEFSNGRPSVSRWRIRRRLNLVGRVPGCRVEIGDASVSRLHCALVSTAAGVWLIDLLGKGGTEVNGENVRWARLRAGDRLRIGTYWMSFWREGPPADDSPAFLPSAQSVAGGRLDRLARSFAPPHSEVALAPQTLLMPIIEQFGQMQQQMFDQFQQCMLMMAQMFGALHRDQMELMRDELSHLHRLTFELQGLQVELARLPPPDRADPVETPGSVPEIASAPPQEEAPPAEIAAGPEPRELLANGAAAPARGAAMPPGQDIHAWLSERIAVLQRERQSRWQKMLEFVLGK